MGRRGVEAKPAWLRVFVPDGNLARLVARPCDGCRHWVIEQRDPHGWDTYDAGIVSGNDIAIAVILRRPMARIRWNDTFRQPTLVGVWGERGLTPDGQYLAAHRCGLAPVSRSAFKPPRRRPAPRMLDLPDISDGAVRELERVWRTPLSQLRRRDAKEAS